MTLDELLQRRLVFIAGKGGVGKSTIAASLAIVAVRAGKTACIVETDGQEQMAHLFQTKNVGYAGKTLAPNIRSISITTESALKEYVSSRLPLKSISRRLINNRLVRYFLDATPGLKELLALGKITDMVKDETADLIIVDLPATGHGMAMLDVPNVVIDAVHAGPLRNHAEKTFRVINDPAISTVCFVTLAEELATTETIELRDTIQKRMSIALGPVIANGVHTPLAAPKELKHLNQLKRQWAKDEERSLLIEGAELAIARTELNDRYLAIIREAFEEEPLVIPFLFIEAIDRDAIAQISDHLIQGGVR